MVPKRSSQENVVTKIGLAPTNVITKTRLALANESNGRILPMDAIILPRETNLALPNEPDEERLERLILRLRKVSTTKKGP